MGILNDLAEAVVKQAKAEIRVSAASKMAEVIDEGEDRNKDSALFLSAGGLVVNYSGHEEIGKLMGKTASRLRSKK